MKKVKPRLSQIEIGAILEYIHERRCKGKASHNIRAEIRNKFNLDAQQASKFYKKYEKKLGQEGKKFDVKAAAQYLKIVSEEAIDGCLRLNRFEALIGFVKYYDETFVADKTTVDMPKTITYKLMDKKEVEDQKNLNQAKQDKEDNDGT